jgi:hypothetical protein
MKSILSTKNLSLMALMSALLCLLAPISIPIGPVPITLSIFIIYIISYILDANSALISVFIYLLMGIVGLPVFAGYKSGLGVILGPSGGYLISYLVVVYISSYYNNKYYYNKILQLLFMFITLILCYVCGTIWFSIFKKMTFIESLFICVFPFIITDVIKIIAACMLGNEIRKRLR